jgi:hypothetical protein
MKSPLRYLFPRDVRNAPGNMRGEEARRLAERELSRVQSETPYYEGLGRDLRVLRERNHLADNIRATIRTPRGA